MERHSPGTGRPGRGPPLCIFDLDGTLVDSRRDLRTAVNRMRETFGLGPLDLHTVSSYIGDGVHKLVERSLPGQIIAVAQALPVFEEAYAHHLHDETALYPGVGEGLRAIHGAGVRLALSSNKSHRFCLRILEHFGLLPLFADVFGGDDTRHLKPHPEALRVILKRAGSPRDRAWMIGDHVTDLAAARRAGLRSVFVKYGYGHPDGLVPTFEVDRFEQLTELVLAHLGSAPG